MVYTFDSRFDKYHATKIYKIVSAGALAKQSGTRITEALKTAGISYRKTQMLHDIRRARAIEFCKTPEATRASGYFFDYVYEPFRDLHGFTASEVNRIIRNKERGIWEDIEELEMINDLEERYLEIIELV